jgi:serine/threonine protein kinase
MDRNRLIGGKFLVQHEIGGGGMGEIFLAIDTKLRNRKVALKAIRPELLVDEEARQRFDIEMATLATLSHDGVAKVYESVDEGADRFLVMEYVDGHDIAWILKKHSRIPPAVAVSLFRRVLDAFEHIHSNGITHRDVKPSNILVTPWGSIKVIDFGIARAGFSEGLTKFGRNMGTSEYMAPETCLTGVVDRRSDLYALGIVLYELLSGQPPFTRWNKESGLTTDFAIQEAHCKRPPPPLSSLAPDIPADLAAVVMRALEKNPDKRYQTSGEFKHSLDDVIAKREWDREAGEAWVKQWIFRSPSDADRLTPTRFMSNDSESRAAAPAKWFRRKTDKLDVVTAKWSEAAAKSSEAPKSKRAVWWALGAMSFVLICTGAGGVIWIRYQLSRPIPRLEFPVPDPPKPPVIGTLMPGNGAETAAVAASPKETPPNDRIPRDKSRAGKKPASPEKPPLDPAEVKRREDETKRIEWLRKLGELPAEER